MTTNSRLHFRPLTAICVLIAVVFIAVAIVYFSRTADALPSFFPGHQAGVTRHHTKHGLAFLGLALLALIGAWFTTAPARIDTSTGPTDRDI